MYKHFEIDETKYEEIDEYPTGRFQYRLINLPKSYSREDLTHFCFKRCIYDSGIHYGEKVAYEISRIIGMKACMVELYKSTKNMTKGYDEGSISFYDISADEKILSGLFPVRTFCNGNGFEEYERYPSIDLIFNSVYGYFQSKSRPYSEFEKFKQDFISMTVFDIKFGNFDRALRNWSLRENIRTGEIELYPMFDNEAILGFGDEVEDIGLTPENISDYNERIISSVCRPEDRQNHKRTKSFDMFEYLCEKYSKETKKALEQVNKCSLSDLTNILDQIPDLPPERKKFAIGNFLYRDSRVRRIHERQAIKALSKSKVKIDA